MTQRWRPEDAQCIRYPEILAVVEPSLGLKPAIPHERTLQIAFSSRPTELAEAGWTYPRVVTPDFCRAPATKMNPRTRRHWSRSRRTITIVEKIETETPAFITVMDEMEMRQQPGVNIDDRLRSIPGSRSFRRPRALRRIRRHKACRYAAWVRAGPAGP